ncbi:unnamed protein product [Parnassius apollo]|uniref:(apollo) hypothetical protein n=1 Tax=Parnassius apollo TaxID=110799 RepID=A0A8S3W8X1_PARAO|nr:unnamed protein product [Parnassius apollo]
MDNVIQETNPQLSRKRTQQKENWKCNKMKKERYAPKEPPNLRIPCNHYAKAYRCTSLSHADIIAFNRRFYKKTGQNLSG